jgi:hypothetical protein
VGTLDDAIREHLELKRQRGAGENEIKEAEADAFGPGEDVPDVPGASITAPAGEGDQLDKVFSPPEAMPESPPEAVAVEPDSPVEVPAPTDIPDVPPVDEATVEVDVVEPAPSEAEAEDDAGDALEREREHLLGHPTENYDVDAAIAEEEELDMLSESRLSDELDRALGAPEEIPPAPEPIEPLDEPASAELALDEPSDPVGEVVEEEIDVEEEVAIIEEEVEVLEVETPDSEFDPISEDPISEDPIQDDSDSGEIQLDDTPDFLEDSPEGEDLWFEQKEPNDFDFGD